MSKHRCGVHKWKRTNLTKDPKKSPYIVYQCVDCPSYKRLDLMLGEKFRCWRCGEVNTYTNKHRDMAKPICTDCIIPKKKTEEVREAAAGILKDLTKGLK